MHPNKPEELKRRTKTFGLRVISLISSLPRTDVAVIIGKQLVRCATAIGANYRSACRARSRADFISKIGVVEEESDEAVYWLEVLLEARMVNVEQVADLLKEGSELTAIFAASEKTARSSRE